jgi:hypothetical protein
MKTKTSELRIKAGNGAIGKRLHALADRRGMIPVVVMQR